MPELASANPAALPWHDSQVSDELPRALGIVVCAIGVVAGACGLTEGFMFAAPSLLKYSLTVAAPAIGIVLLTSKRPLRLAVGLTIICIPFGGAKATFAGEKISLLMVMLVLSAVVAILNGPKPQALSRVGIAGTAGAGLLIVPILIGGDSGTAVVIVAMTCVAWLVSRVAREGESGLTTIYWAVAAAAALQAVIAIYEFKTNHRLNLYGSAGAGVSESTYFGTAAGHAGESHSTQRPSGTFYDPISLANTLALSCPIIVVLAARTREFVGRLVLGIAGLLVALALALTFSRFSWIGAAAGTLIACLALPRMSLRIGALLGVVGMLAIAAALALAVAGPRLVSRFETISNPTEASNRITAKGDRVRVEDWQVDIKTFLSHPFAGVGFGNISQSLARYVPNVQEGSNGQSTYLQIAAEAGILGVAALVLLLGAMANATYRGLVRSRLLAAGALGGGVAVLVVWVTDVTIRYTPVAAFFAILIGVAAALPTLNARQLATARTP